MNQLFLISSLFLICNLLPLAITAQETNDSLFSKGIELSIIAEDIFAKSNYPYYYFLESSSFFYYPSYHASNYRIPKVGFGCKYHLETFSLRSHISVGYNKSSNNNSFDKNSSSNSVLSTLVRVGFEFHKDFKKLFIFYGLDGFFGYSKNYSKYVNYKTANEISSYNKSYITNTGLNPVLGVKYFLYPHLSLSTEIRFIVEFYSGKDESGSTTISKDQSSDISGLNTYLGPLGQISINIHL